MNTKTILIISLTKSFEELNDFDLYLAISSRVSSLMKVLSKSKIRIGVTMNVF